MATPEQIMAELQQAINALPDPVEKIVFGGDLPQMVVISMRQLADRWRAAGSLLHFVATNWDALFSDLPITGGISDSLVETATEIKNTLQEQANFCDSAAAQCDDSALETEKAVWEMVIFGLLTTQQLLMAAGHGGILSVGILATARRKFLLMLDAFIARIGMSGAAAAATRVALPILGYSTLPAGIEAGVQGAQMLGDRENLDTKSIAAMGLSGLGSVIGGFAATGAAAKFLPGRQVATHLSEAIGGAVGAVAGQAPITGLDWTGIGTDIISGAALGLAGARMGTRPADGEFRNPRLGDRLDGLRRGLDTGPNGPGYSGRREAVTHRSDAGRPPALPESGRSDVTDGRAATVNGNRDGIPHPYESARVIDRSAEGPSQHFERITRTFEQLGRGAIDNVVVVGSLAWHAALGIDGRPGDVDMVARDGDFLHHLMRQEGWSTGEWRGGIHITNSEAKIEIMGGRLGDHGATFDQLKKFGWKLPTGETIASVEHLLSNYQSRARAFEMSHYSPFEKSVESQEKIRRTLLDPDRPALSANVVARHIEALRNVMPEQALQHPDAELFLRLAADGYHLNGVLQGGYPGIDTINRIGGSKVNPKAPEFATYHHARNVVPDMKGAFLHMATSPGRDFTPYEYLIVGASITNSDGSFGNGRLAQQDKVVVQKYIEIYNRLITEPHFYDEIMGGDSALLSNVRAHDELLDGLRVYMRARGLGVDHTSASRIAEGARNEEFDQASGGQRARFHRDPLVRISAASDLRGIHTVWGMKRTEALSYEDPASTRTEELYKQVLGYGCHETGIEFRSIADARRMTTEYHDLKPTTRSELSVGQVIGKFYMGNLKFLDPVDGYQFPYGFRDIPEIRISHARLSHEIGSLLFAGKIRTEDAAEIIDSYTQKMIQEHWHNPYAR